MVQKELKNSYPLTNINSPVDVALSYIILSFCNAFFEYNQILMCEEDWPKIAFITNKGVLYYKVMPFGLKNVRAIY